MSLEELDRIDREWEKERERYMVTTKYGRRYKPSTGAAVVVGLFSVSMGLVWTMTSFALAQGFGPLAGIFPLFGVVFAIGGAVISTYQFNKAKRYQAACEAYQLRRSIAQDQLKE
jgi:hypothetical protein